MNGVLLLDSILQAPVAEESDAPITLELTLADVSQLFIRIQCIEVCYFDNEKLHINGFKMHVCVILKKE